MAFGKLFAVAAALATGPLFAAVECASDAFNRIESIADEASARAAVRCVSSACVLEMIARKSKSWRLRADAIYRIPDETVRKEIFETDSDWRVKGAALFHMIDAGFVERVACDEKEAEAVRAIAAAKVRNRDVLERLKSSSSPLVGRFAAQQLPPVFLEAKEVPVPETTFTDIKDVTRQ